MILADTVIPAVRNLRDFEKSLETKHDVIVILEVRLGQVKSIVKTGQAANKKVLLHIDLIKGLKADDYGVEFLVNEIKPDGIISTRGNVVEMVKKRGLLAIQRVFLLDSLSLENNIKNGERYQPDYIEILPGKLPEVLDEIKKETDIPIIAGGFITEKKDIETALNAGAIAVSTSASNLW